MPVTTNTLFNCASMSKVFTAAAISLLVDGDQNYLDVQWKAPVSSLIRDDLVLSDPRYTEEVTVEDNFSHRSRLLEYILTFCVVQTLNLLILAAMMMLASVSLPKNQIRLGQ
jgi:CubicO group peptidase (beta-lactamase class C family)